MSYSSHDPDGQLSIGQSAPEFSLLNVTNGEIVNFSCETGVTKASVVIFSCNHCPWVIKYEERMIALAREFQPLGVSFYVISSNDVIKFPQDGPVSMKERTIQKGYPFPYLYDESQEVARAYGAQVTPHVFLFDGDLILRYRGAIDDNADRDPRATKHYLRDAIETILAGRGTKPATATTRAIGCSVKWK